jgi:hypothetical protein
MVGHLLKIKIMKEREFIIWLQGFLEGAKEIDTKAKEIIISKMNTVLAMNINVIQHIGIRDIKCIHCHQEPCICLFKKEESIRPIYNEGSNRKFPDWDQPFTITCSSTLKNTE